jgi:hypothetical protein
MTSSERTRVVARVDCVVSASRAKLFATESAVDFSEDDAASRLARDRAFRRAATVMRDGRPMDQNSPCVASSPCADVRIPPHRVARDDRAASTSVACATRVRADDSSRRARAVDASHIVVATPRGRDSCARASSRRTRGDDDATTQRVDVAATRASRDERRAIDISRVVTRLRSTVNVNPARDGAVSRVIRDVLARLHSRHISEIVH